MRFEVPAQGESGGSPFPDDVTALSLPRGVFVGGEYVERWRPCE